MKCDSTYSRSDVARLVKAAFHVALSVDVVRWTHWNGRVDGVADDLASRSRAVARYLQRETVILRHRITAFASRHFD